MSALSGCICDRATHRRPPERSAEAHNPQPCRRVLQIDAPSRARCHPVGVEFNRRPQNAPREFEEVRVMDSTQHGLPPLCRHISRYFLLAAGRAGFGSSVGKRYVTEETRATCRARAAPPRDAPAAANGTPTRFRRALGFHFAKVRRSVHVLR